jgi:hypothetical protein
MQSATGTCGTPKLMLVGERAEMKTASLGLLEVIVVRAYAGGECPPGPPLFVCVFFLQMKY